MRAVQVDRHRRSMFKSPSGTTADVPPAGHPQCPPVAPEPGRLVRVTLRTAGRRCAGVVRSDRSEAADARRCTPITPVTHTTRNVQHAAKVTAVRPCSSPLPRTEVVPRQTTGMVGIVIVGGDRKWAPENNMAADSRRMVVIEEGKGEAGATLLPGTA